MSIGKYTALLKAVELGSISRAAEQLGYTQSAVSRMIADLERDWGMELLHRNRPGIEVTSAGQQLLPILRSITADCAQLQYTVQELHGIQAGLVQVGTFTTVSDKLVPELLTSFHKQYPGISFKLLHSESYSEIEEWLRRGKVDCGFVRIPSANDLDVHFLRRDMLAAVLPLDHPLAHAPFFPVSAFAGESFIKLKIDDEISRFIEQLPAPPDLRYEVSSDHTILSMVECGAGVSILHSVMAGSGRYRVLWKPLDINQYRDIAIATNKNTRLSGAARLFVQHVCREIPARCDSLLFPGEPTA